MAGSAATVIYRSRAAEADVWAEPGMAAGADGSVGRWRELLPVEAPGGASACADPL